MASGGEPELYSLPENRNLSSWSPEFAENILEQNDEILALESIFEGDGEEEFLILQRPSSDIFPDDFTQSSGIQELFTVMLRIPVSANDEEIQVDICMPVDSKLHGKDTQTLQYKRSDSGQRLLGSFRVSHLTPLRLVAVLPPDYPSQGPPTFTLTSDWLSHAELGALCKALDEVWTESPGIPILFTWTDWLKNNALSHLGLSNHIMLNQTDQDDIVDSRAYSDCLDVMDTADQLLRYNQQQAALIFQRDTHECPVCFTERLGRECVRFNMCGHFFCVDCATEFCKHHIQEGSVSDLRCPEPKCETEIPPYMIKNLLGDDEFSRFEKLALSRALDKMRDIVWCPRCEQPVIKDSKQKHGLCANCFFSFCTHCMDKWHQGTKCFDEEERKIDEENEREKKKEEERLSDKFNRALRRKEEFQSRSFVQQYCKQCPSCDMDIMKDGGCNKVHCMYCGKSMCWKCGADITNSGYGHFNVSAGCQGFDPVMDGMFYRVAPQLPPRRPPKVHVPHVIDQELALHPEQRKNLVICPKCKRRNLKEDRNNHVKCWACGMNICFMCREIIRDVPITRHFSADKPCRQHS